MWSGHRISRTISTDDQRFLCLFQNISSRCNHRKGIDSLGVAVPLATAISADISASAAHDPQVCPQESKASWRQRTHSPRVWRSSSQPRERSMCVVLAGDRRTRRQPPQKSDSRALFAQHPLRSTQFDRYSINLLIGCSNSSGIILINTLFDWALLIYFRYDRYSLS